jgi:hypothetical protein
MTLKVIGVYSSNSRLDRNKVLQDTTINKEIYSGNEWREDTPVTDTHQLSSATRLSRLTEITKQLLSTPITKLPQDYIILSPGGVHGDKHFASPERAKRDGISYIRQRVNQVNIFAKEELDRLNKKINTSVQGGALGENILTEGFDIDSLPLNTILKIGNEVTLRVSARRSFCAKFIGAFYRKDYFTKNDHDKFDKERTGLATQVITGGIVKVGDLIEIIMPATHVPLTIKGAMVKFELHNPNDPTSPPIPDLK